MVPVADQVAVPPVGACEPAHSTHDTGDDHTPRETLPFTAPDQRPWEISVRRSVPAPVDGRAGAAEFGTDPCRSRSPSVPHSATGEGKQRALATGDPVAQWTHWCSNIRDNTARPAQHFSDYRSGSRRTARQRLTVRSRGKVGVRTRNRPRSRREGLPQLVHFSSVAGHLAENVPEFFEEPPWTHAEFDEGLVLGDTTERCPDAGESEDVLYISCLFAELFHTTAFDVLSSFAPSTVAADIGLHRIESARYRVARLTRGSSPVCPLVGYSH